MPADRRNSKTYFQRKLGEWAFSMKRLPEGFRLRNKGLFPKRIPKVPFGESLLPFASSRKEVPAPARGASLRQQNFHGEPQKNKFYYARRKVHTYLRAAKPHRITPSQRERFENARRQTKQQDLCSDETRRVGIFNGAPSRGLSFKQ